MARRRSAPRRRSSKKFPAWALVVIGLIAGSAVAWGIHLYLERTEARNASARAPLARSSAATTPTQGAEAKPKPKPAQQKPRFEFYTILTANESVVSEKERKTRPARSARTEEGTRFVLQAASYTHEEEADRLRAKLALSGLEAHIEKIAIEGKGEYYRVRLGPYSKVEDADGPSRQLAQIGVKAILIKVRKSPDA